MTKKSLLIVTMLIAASSGVAARATTLSLKFSGPISGRINLIYSANPDTGVLPGTSPNPVDPIGSSIVTGISGSFSDPTLGIVNTAITGIVPSSPAHPEPTNLLAPHSFGFYIITDGVAVPGGGTAPGLSYDNLFYRAGSPQTASDYPFHGGFLDIYGIVFTTADGKAVNFWSNGDMGSGVSYGAGVTDGKDVLDYVGGLAVTAVPEPASWALMLAGFGLIGAVKRSRTRASRA